MTYQQAPCPKATQEDKVDATPANTEYDASGREHLLKQGDEAGKRLEARAAADEAERRRRQGEREAIAREKARTMPTHIYGAPPSYPRPGYPPPRPSRPEPAPR